MAQSVAIEARTRMLRVILVLPGATDLDSQGRIKGSLDVPLNHDGNQQARQSADELRDEPIETVYCSPCLSARQTAELLAGERTRVRVNEELRNLNRGLWHGKRVEELRDSQPRIYRQWQDQPETVCPPDGETIEDARRRIGRVIDKICRKHKRGTIAMVVPEPAASVLRQQLSQTDSMGDLWQAECRCGQWESIEVATGRAIF